MSVYVVVCCVYITRTHSFVPLSVCVFFVEGREARGFVCLFFGSDCLLLLDMDQTCGRPTENEADA